MLYIAECKIETFYYMDDNTKRNKLISLVEADDECQAIKKIEAHYNASESSYDVSYSVHVENISEVIQ